MKKYNVLITRDALRDLENLKTYLVSAFGNQVADKAIEKIESDISNLSTFPSVGLSITTINPDLDKSYYILISKHNVLFYRIYRSENLIRVLKVYSTKQDFTRRIVSYFNEN